MAFHAPTAAQKSISLANQLGATMSTVLRSPWQGLGRTPSVASARQLSCASSPHRSTSNAPASTFSPSAVSRLGLGTPFARTMPSALLRPRQYSTLPRNGPLSQLRQLPKPGMVGLNLVQQRSLFGGPSHDQLARLEDAANNNPNSATSQASFYSALML